jgi:hypothetical protein
MTDAGDQLIAALDELESVAAEATADEAADGFDEATLQVFWQRWPRVSSWAGSLWRRLDESMADAAVPADRSEDHDLGGEGG